MNQYAGTLEDLPDGSSRFEGLVAGLDNLFSFGGFTPDEVFGRTADWRRRIKGSVFADLIEAMAFGDWAYAARGTGGANTVSGQNMALFAYRAEMAAAALSDLKDRAANNLFGIRCRWMSVSTKQRIKRRQRNSCVRYSSEA